MARQNDEIISLLNDLIETCKDGENGFRTAAEGVKNSHLKTLFHTYARQRSQFAAELQEEVRAMGTEPEKASSVAGSLHRGWINIKAAVTRGSESSIISEVERGEDAAVKAYQKVMHSALPPDLESIVERQFRQVKEAHDRIRSLEQQQRAA